MDYKDERFLLHLTSELWNEFLKLPDHQPSEQADFSAAIRTAQRIIATRVARRVLPDRLTVNTKDRE